MRAVVTQVDAKGAGSGDGLDESVTSSGGPVSKKSETAIALSWKVDNPDKDELRYRIQYRLIGSTHWFDLLKPTEKLTKETYSWDTSDLPEGRYRLRVVATDELSNPPDRVTKDEMESGVVLVDNTAPSIENLRIQGRPHIQTHVGWV